VRRVAYPLWIWQRLTTMSLRKKTKQTLCFYCMVTAKRRKREIGASFHGLKPMATIGKSLRDWNRPAGPVRNKRLASAAAKSILSGQ